MQITLKNYKPCHNLSEETLAFTGTIWIDGAKAGTVSNNGHGGCNMYRFADRCLEKRFHDYCESGPEIETDIGNGETFTYKPDSDSVIGDLCDKAEVSRNIKRWTRSAVIFRTEGMDEGSFKTVKTNGIDRAQVKAWIYKNNSDVVEMYG